jgi:predicted hotdog family 3-hydroxylacyl-ACP dehydratase
VSRGSFPAVGELIPHARGMLLLGSVLEHSSEHAVCSAVPAASRLFQDAALRVPAWLGLEYLAQCMAVYEALEARAAGRPPRIGPFIGGRRLRLRADHFEPEQVLRVTVRHLRGERGLVAFEGSIQDGEHGEPLVEGRLHVYSSEAWTERMPGAAGSRRHAP